MMFKLILLLTLALSFCMADVDMDVDFDFDIQDQEIEIKSQFDNGTHEDKLKYRIYGGDHPHIEVTLSSEVNDVEKEFQFEIEFKKIFEFVPANPSDPDLSYKEFKDTIINEIEDFEIKTFEDLTPNSNTSKKFRLAGKNNFFVADIKLKIAEPSDIKFNPKDIKIDITINTTEIREWGWLQNSTSRIGLKVKVKTETEIDDDRDDDDVNPPLPDVADTVHLPFPKSNAGFFTWVNYLECWNGSKSNSTRVKIHASKLEIDNDPDELERSFKVYFTLMSKAASSDLPRGYCIWDPVIGSQTYVDPTPSKGTNSVSHIFASLLLVALALFN